MLLPIDNQAVTPFILCKQSRLFFFNKAKPLTKRKHIPDFIFLKYAFVAIKTKYVYSRSG